MKHRPHGEAKIYAGLLAGFALCLWLFTIWLPSLGMASLARQIDEYANKAAPCLLSPLVALLIARLRRRGPLPFSLALIGGVAFLFWFFVIFELPLAITGLALLGIAVALGYKVSRTDQPKATTDWDRGGLPIVPTEPVSPRR
jgi:hypothetical protein